MLRTQDNPLEKVIKKENPDDCKEDLEKYLLGKTGSETNKLKYDGCPLEFEAKNLLVNHCPKCPKKLREKESIHESNGDEDLENYLSRHKDSEMNKFKCDEEFEAKNLLINHCPKCPKQQQEEESIQELNSDKGLVSCLHKEENLDWNDFKCYACSLEFASKEQLEAHYREFCKEEGGLSRESNGNEDLGKDLTEEKYSETSNFKCDPCTSDVEAKILLVDHCTKCPKKQQEEESIQVLNSNKAGLVCSFCKEENFEKETFEQHIKRCEKYYSQLNTTVISKESPNAHILANHSDPEKSYKCSHCMYSSYIKAKLVKHMRTHTNERHFKCGMCDYAAIQKRTLTSHILVQHSNSEKSYKCDNCKYSTHEKGKLIAHMRSHTNERPFKCESCNYAATQSSNLKAHILVKHSNAEKRYKCNDCKYSAYGKGTLVKHMLRMHTNERPFKCDICDFTTIQKSALMYHTLAKHSKSENRCKCNDGKYSTQQKGKLVSHMRIHTNESCNYATVDSTNPKAHILAKHSNAEKKYKCNDFKYSAYKKGSLVKHMHTDEKPFKCDMCDYITVRKTSLASHSLAKHSKSEKRYKCNQCTYSAHEKGMLVSHIRTHTNERRFKCESCNYASVQSANLKAHILAKHSNAEKRYKCNDCEYSAHEKGNLERHMRTHNNERPFKCDMCDYTAAQMRSVKTHILAKHTNLEKRFKCDVCEYSTHEKGNLVRHMRIHNNERPFKCNMCDYAATQMSSVKTHILAKHSNSEKRHKCNDCEIPDEIYLQN